MRVICFIPMILTLIISLIGDSIISAWYKIDDKMQINLFCTMFVIGAVVVFGNIFVWLLS